MAQHRNARLTVQGRLTLARRMEQGRTVGHVADAIGVSRTTARRWLSCWQAEGESAWLAPGCWSGSCESAGCGCRAANSVGVSMSSAECGR